MFSKDFLQVESCLSHAFDEALKLFVEGGVGGVTAEAVQWAFTTGYASNWFPLTWISLMVDFEIYGLDPAGYHATNLLLHILNTLLLFGVFASYLASSQLIIDDVFGLADRFPLVFGGLAAVMGVTALANASMVQRFGARRIVGHAIAGYMIVAGILVVVAVSTGGRPGFWVFACLLAALLSMNTLLSPNLHALAMEPMGRVAGTASALIGTVQVGGGALLGSLVDHTYDGTITPLAVAFLGFGVLAWLAVRWGAAEH